MLKTLCASVAIMAAVTSSMAFANKAPGSGPNPYVDCGIGAALFSDVHWAAVTSNVIWDLGTTAVTSATASPETCSGKNVQAAVFIKDTYGLLAEETARGEGEHLTSVLDIMGCARSQHAAAIHSIRQDMAGHVANPAYTQQQALEKAADLFISTEQAARTHCAA